MSISWAEAVYVANYLSNQIKLGSKSGIPPRPIGDIYASGSQAPVAYFIIQPISKGVNIIVTEPALQDTIVSGQIICNVAGIRVVAKEGSRPTGPDDGIHLGNIRKDDCPGDFQFTGLETGKTYYICLFTYSDQDVLNLNTSKYDRVVPT